MKILIQMYSRRSNQTKKNHWCYIIPPSPIPIIPLFSIVVNTHSIPGLKDYLLSRDTTKLEKLEEDEMTREKRFEASNECLAVIPWVPNPIMAWKEIVAETGQTLEAEDNEMMEMDEPYAANNNNDKLEACGVSSLPYGINNSNV